ncbi:hypothetical protein ACH5RR_006527 [Cinchona calisaya]|uniref:Uncharacterized protein n=1 Tax=Cinchona calisaya TaxID=153742 RepID=A0ABD3APB1_9GENT
MPSLKWQNKVLASEIMLKKSSNVEGSGMTAGLRHKEARDLWNMKFSYLDELQLVYGKDRANGEVVEDYEDVVNNLEAEKKSVEAASYVNCETDDEISNCTSRIQKRQTVHLSKKPKTLKTSAAPTPSPYGSSI